MFKKKSQISIFIIFTIIILIVGLTTFFFFKDDIFGEVGSEYKTNIKTEVENCINQDLESSITFLGLQAGYLDIPKEIEFNPQRYTNFGIKIPNWDPELNKIPSVLDMENSINSYLENNSLGCIKSSIKSLKNVYDIKADYKQYKINTKIGLDNIQVEVILPIEFSQINIEEIYYLDKFQFGIEEIYLGTEYELAKKIFENELQTGFLEDKILDQIKNNNDYTSSQSIPTEGIYVDCSPRIWTYSQLKKNLIDSNNNNFKYLQIKNTQNKNFEFESNFKNEYGNLDSKIYFENFYNIDIGLDEETYKNFLVEFSTPISSKQTSAVDFLFGFRKFEVTPNNGEFINGIDFNIGEFLPIPIPCIKIFSHKYDLDYDVLVKIKNLNEESKGYTFQFPIRIQIDKSTQKTKQDLIFNIDEENINNGKFCSLDNRNHKVDINVFDINGDNLEDVKLNYNCIKLNCDIGKTEKPKFQGITRDFSQPILNTKLPDCYNGQLIAEKKGYLKNFIYYDSTNQNNNLDEAEIELKKLISYNINQNNLDLINIEDILNKKKIFTKEDGLFYITIKNKENQFTSTTIWCGSDCEYGIDSLSKLELIEGENIYDISLIYVDNNENTQGFYFIEDLKLDTNLINNFKFKIPFISKGIDENTYSNYDIKVKELEQNGFLKFGILIE